MHTNSSTQAALESLKLLFQDQPDLMGVISLGSVESEEFLKVNREEKGLFSEPVKLYVVGRTGAGKTSIGNRLFGDEVMRSTGYMDCTDYIGMLKLKSNLWYFDTPGAGSEDAYENITRAALGIEQIDDDDVLVEDFKVLDFTDASKHQDAQEKRVTSEAWRHESPPDVILFVAAPDKQWLRQDRDFLKALLQKHAPRLLITLNIFTRSGKIVHTSENMTDVRKKIKQTYQKHADSITPQFVEINALTGTGLSEIASKICELLPRQKLGKIQTVLQEDLKGIAGKELKRRFQHVLNRIVARLSYRTVDQQLGDLDVLRVAALGIVQYAVILFRDETETGTWTANLEALAVQEAATVRKDRTDDITVQEPQIRERQLTKTVPVERTEQTHQTVTVPYQTFETKEVPKGFVGRLLAGITGGKKTDTVVEPKQGEREISIPVTHTYVEYEEVPGELITEVVAVGQRVIGEKALEGGVPAIEFLISLGMGIYAFCYDQENRKSVHEHITEARNTVQTRLSSSKPRLEQLIQQGAAREQEIITLLDSVLID